jgi:invasion protein IalB
MALAEQQDKPAQPPHGTHQAWAKRPQNGITSCQLCCLSSQGVTDNDLNQKTLHSEATHYDIFPPNQLYSKLYPASLASVRHADLTK